MTFLLSVVAAILAAAVAWRAPAAVRRHAASGATTGPSRASPSLSRGPGLAATAVATAGVVAAALVLRWAASVPELAALAVLVPAAVRLACVDAACLRLPDPLTVPLALAAAAILGLGAAWRGDVHPLVRAVGGATALTALHGAAAACGGMGGGDVKLATAVGLCLAYRDTSALVAATAGALGAAVLVGAVAAVRRRPADDLLPYGPLILAAATGALLA